MHKLNKKVTLLTSSIVCMTLAQSFSPAMANSDAATKVVANHKVDAFSLDLGDWRMPAASVVIVVPKVDGVQKGVKAEKVEVVAKSDVPLQPPPVSTSGRAVQSALEIRTEQVNSPLPSENSPGANPVRGIYKAFLAARSIEPTFQTAKAELGVGQNDASASRAALYPQLQFSRTKLDTETVPRTTVQLSQPIIALDRFATFFEASHKDNLANSTFEQREQELATRLFKVVSDLIRNSEGLRANRHRIEALNQQFESAQRMYNLGQGTITDASSTRVQLGQAKADGLNLEAKYEEARRLYSHTCGELPDMADIKLVRRVRNLSELKGFSDVQDNNTQVRIAKLNYEIAQLEAWKAKSAALPTVQGVVTRSQINGLQNSYMGLSLVYPIAAQGLYGISNANANRFKSQELLREAEEKLQLDRERLKTLVSSGIIETGVRLETIQTAEMNVIANEKSFKGGVRSKTDVLNSIDQLFKSNDDYIASMLTLADNYMNYLLAENVRTETALQLVNNLLFR